MTLFPSFPDDTRKLRILLSNDDGIYAPGLQILERIARQLTDDIWIVAPESEQSGVAHSLSLHQPVRIKQLAERRFSVKGTPTDSVLMAAKIIIPRDHKIDLVLSGVNLGANMAEDVTYSGTVACAMEGTLLQIPSIAMSLANTIGQDLHWDTPEIHAPNLIKHLLKIKWRSDTLLNINFPDVSAGEVKGIKIAPLGQRQINEKVIENLDPFGRPYYWIGGPLRDDFEREDVDLAWNYKGYITVTPLCLDLSHHQMIEEMEKNFG